MPSSSLFTMMPRVYQLGIHLLKAKRFQSQCVRFARGRRGAFDPEASDEFRRNRNAAHASAYDEDTLAEELREELDELGLPLDDLGRGRGERTGPWLKNKILEKKHFRQPQETNLLTWAAKAQIRFLNQQSPQEWTPERLAQSFPVSREGVIRLLKSKWAPESEEKRIKHDIRVLKQWKALARAGGSAGAGPIHPVLQQLLESGRLGLMRNAQGIPGLPAPASRTEEASRPPTLGPFSSILLQVQPKLRPPPASQSQTRILEEAQTLLEKFRLLGQQQVMPGRDGPQDIAVGGGKGIPNSGHTKEVSQRKHKHHFSAVTENTVVSGRREDSQGQVPHHPRERVEAEERVTPTPPRRRRRRSSIDRDGQIESLTPDVLLQLEMQGTYKIPHDSRKKDRKGEED